MTRDRVAVAVRLHHQPWTLTGSEHARLRAIPSDSIWFHLVEQVLCNAKIAGENRVAGVAGEEIEM